MNLSKKQLKTLDRAIAARHEKLVSAAQEHVLQARVDVDELSTLASAVGDPVDQATADLLRDADNAALVRDEKELRELEAARSRIATGAYGVCIDCGQEIAFERLIAYPTASRCLICQDIFERTHVHPGGAAASSA